MKRVSADENCNLANITKKPDVSQGIKQEWKANVATSDPQIFEDDDEDFEPLSPNVIARIQKIKDDIFQDTPVGLKTMSRRSSPRNLSKTDADNSWLHYPQTSTKKKNATEQSKPSSKPKRGQGKNRGAWTQEEDCNLIRIVQARGATGWSQIASDLGTGRNGRQCRERWSNQINPELDRSKWTQEEDQIILDAHNKYGNKWATIAKLLPGRTDNMVKNRFNGSLLPRQKGEASGGPKTKRKEKPSARRQTWPSRAEDRIRDGLESDTDDDYVLGSSMSERRTKKRPKRASAPKYEVDSPFASMKGLKTPTPMESPFCSWTTPRPIGDLGSVSNSAARFMDKMMDIKPWSPGSYTCSPVDSTKRAMIMDDWEHQPSPVGKLNTPCKRDLKSQLDGEDEFMKLEAVLLPTMRSEKFSSIRLSPMPSSSLLEKTPQRNASIASAMSSCPGLCQSLVSSGNVTPSGSSEKFSFSPLPSAQRLDDLSKTSAKSSSKTLCNNSTYLEEETLNSFASKELPESYSIEKDGWKFSKNPCKCTKSRCLKLYCTCFSSRLHCGPGCECNDCINNGPNTKWYAAFMNQYQKNPRGFCKKKSDLSCKCKNTSCLKKYCVCYTRGVQCGESCTCVDCKNTTDRKETDADTTANSTMLGELSESNVSQLKAEAPTKEETITAVSTPTAVATEDVE